MIMEVVGNMERYCKRSIIDNEREIERMVAEEEERVQNIGGNSTYGLYGQL